MPSKDGHLAVLLGASGLVGEACLSALIESPRYSEIRTISRRSLGRRAEHEKITEVVVDFDAIEAYASRLVGEDVFCAFGTTIKKAGSRDRFREVDFEYPRRFAELLLANGARHFLLVSSKGADFESRNFYLRTKGELENALISMSWPRLSIIRPSIIGGRRKESRPLERLGQILLSKAPKQFRTVPASSIANAMIHLAATPVGPTLRVVESGEIITLSKRPS